VRDARRVGRVEYAAVHVSRQLLTLGRVTLSVVRVESSMQQCRERARAVGVGPNAGRMDRQALLELLAGRERERRVRQVPEE
jgi:hypothetical protein